MPVLRRPAVLVAVFVIAAGLAYWRAAGAGFVWDDDDYVTQNPVLRSWAGLWRIWFEPTSLPQYYPLVHTTFWLEYRLVGLEPWLYHVTNVVLHVLAGMLLLRFVRALGIGGALFAALWFVVHPVHVESVAWVTERKNTLSLVCALAAAGRWLRWYDAGRPRDQAIGSVWFLLALLSKTVIATLPAALLVVVWWRDGRLPARAWRGALPWLVAGGLLGATTVWLEATHVGAAGEAWQLAGAERLLVAGRAPWFYLGSLLWPFGVCFNYERWSLDVVDPLQWAWPVATIVALAVAFVLRRRIGRGPLAVLLLFGGMLMPALGFFDVFPFRYSYVADHFQYHASLAVLVGVTAVATRIIVARLGAAPAAVLGGCVLVVLAFRASAQVLHYRDFDTLFERTLECNPRSALALANLGASANVRGESVLAKDLLERCVAIDPGNHEAWTNLGVLAHRGGDRAEARRLYERALSIRPAEASASNNLAVLLLEDGDAAAALALLRPAIARVAEHFECRVTLVDALVAARDWQSGLAAAQHVLARDPGRAATRLQAARCLLRLDQPSPAAANALLVLRGDAGNAAARDVAAEALAEFVRAGPAANARESVVNACRNAGVGEAALLPLVARELARLGAPEHAEQFAAAAGR
jgi:protein O-mannosyl-transferase